MNDSQEIKIAIVGAEENKWTKKQKQRAQQTIKNIFKKYLTEGLKVILVSGRCPKGGVDIWAEEIAKKLGINRIIFSPEKPKWYYYRKRNILIAKTCDILYDIEPEDKKSGGTWTLEYAKKLGKKVFLIKIPKNTTQ